MTASETVLLNLSSIMDFVELDERYSLSQENGYTFFLPDLDVFYFFFLPTGSGKDFQYSVE